QIGMDLVGSLSLWNRLLVGVDVPFLASQSGSLSAIGASTLDSAVMGDLRLLGQVFLAEARAGDARIGSSFALHLTLPTGDADRFASSGTVTAEPRVLVDLRQRGFGIVGGVGARIRDSKQVLNLDAGTQLTLTGGVRVPLYREDMLAAIGEIYGLVGSSGAMDARASPFEALAGLRLRYLDVELTAAAGRGINHDYGT